MFKEHLCRGATVGVVEGVEFAVRKVEEGAAAGVFDVGRNDGRDTQRHCARPLGVTEDVQLRKGQLL